MLFRIRFHLNPDVCVRVYNCVWICSNTKVLATLTAAGWQELDYAAFIEAIDLDAQRNADNGRTSGIIYVYIYIYVCV